MTTNTEESEKPPLTPPNDGKVQFLGPDTVRYISPPRIEVARQRPPPPTLRPVPPPPQPQLSALSAPPPPYQPPVYPVMPQMMPMPMMTYIPQMMPSPPTQVSPSAITLNINTSPQSVTSSASVGGAAGGGALICPKCRKGIVTRQQDRFRKKLLIFLGIFCCPITCGLPLFCLCCNYVDACACCGMNYGHRGRKSHKKKVNAVKI